LDQAEPELELHGAPSVIPPACEKTTTRPKDRFATTWAEISVGCEACHGQGSNHVAWGHIQESWWPFGKNEDKSKGLLVQFDERNGILWRQDPTITNPQRNRPPPLLRKEVETCGLCHARRGAFAQEWVPGQWLSDTHVVTPLTRELYSADGQMRDQEETYNYGPFKQSKMFAAGVTCSDCHDPHSAKLRASADNTYLQCHSADKYAAPRHSHHETANPPVACSSCHMPAHTYMVIDRRHDHSFRVPRPDVSAKLGTPNACNGCHTDKSTEWAATVLDSWFGPDREGFQKYGKAFHATWTDEPDAGNLLGMVAKDKNTPSYVRASALSELAPFISPRNIDVAKTGLADPDPMVRIGALDMLENAPPSRIWQLAAPLLSDTSRGVRIKTVDLLADVPTANQPPADRGAFERAASEFVAAQRVNADRPKARAALGHFDARRGLFVDAEAEYQAALRLSPQYVPAALNLADLYRQIQRDDKGEAILRAAIAAAALHYAIGLTLTRLKRPEEALNEFRRAAELQPESARYAYVLAVALHSAGHADDAISVLRQNLVRHPNDHDTLIAFINFNRDAGNFADALIYAEQLAALAPDDQELAKLILNLRRQVK
jgi:tetratricopeptide (TPR) repeat protein